MISRIPSQKLSVCLCTVFLTCVTTMLHSAALLVLMNSSRMYCGTCVVLPQPVAPRITMTELWWIASRISLSKSFTGKASLSCWIWKKKKSSAFLKISPNQPTLLHICTLSHSLTQVSLTQRKNCLRRKYKLWFVLRIPIPIQYFRKLVAYYYWNPVLHTLYGMFNLFWNINRPAQAWQVTGSALTLCNSWSCSKRYMKSFFKSMLICSGVSWKDKTLFRGFLTPLLTYVIYAIENQSHQDNDSKYQ